MFAAWLTEAPKVVKKTTVGITPGSSTPTSSPNPDALKEKKYLEPGKRHDVMITILSTIGIVILGSALIGVLYLSCTNLPRKINNLSKIVRSERAGSNSPNSSGEESYHTVPQSVDAENRSTESGNS